MSEVTLWTRGAGAVSLGPDLDDEHVYARLHAAVAHAERAKAPCWIDLRGVPRLSRLRSLLGVHPLTLEDMAGREAREKCEAYARYVFVSLRMPAGEDGANVYVLIFRDVLVTAHWAPGVSAESTVNVGAPTMHRVLASRVMQMEGGMDMSSDENATPDWLAYLLVDEVVDDLTARGARLQAEVDAIDELALSLGRFDQTDMVARIYRAHRRTTALQRQIVPKIEVVRALAKHGVAEHTDTEPRSSSAGPTVHGRTLLYLRDVQDHMDALHTALKEHAEALDRAHDNFLAQADVELAVAGHRMNRQVQQLAAFTLMLGVSMAVSSIMGMNVVVPFQFDRRDRPWYAETAPFFFLVVLMAVLSATFFVVGRRFQWL